MRRAKSLRIGVHHANAVVWEPVYRTRLRHRLQELRALLPHDREARPDVALHRAPRFPLRNTQQIRRLFEVTLDVARLRVDRGYRAAQRGDAVARRARVRVAQRRLRGGGVREETDREAAAGERGERRERRRRGGRREDERRERGGDRIRRRGRRRLGGGRGRDDDDGSITRRRRRGLLRGRRGADRRRAAARRARASRRGDARRRRERGRHRDRRRTRCGRLRSRRWAPLRGGRPAWVKRSVSRTSYRSNER